MRKTTRLLAVSIALAAGVNTATAAGAGVGASAEPSGPTRTLTGAGPGLSVTSQPWARWQARLLFSATPSGWRAGLAAQQRSDLGSARLSLLGDYYLSAPASGSARASGLRATGGVLLGPRARPWIGQALAADAAPLGETSSREPFADSAALPYVGVGVGYMAQPGRSGSGQVSGSGWNFGADLGLVAQRPGSAGFSLGRGKSLDDTVRELRLTPLFQVGVSYTF